MKLSALLLVPLLAMGCHTLCRAASSDGFEPIFDGQTLNGWQGQDNSFWSIEDGAITGTISPEHAPALNQYLIWQGGMLDDFELKLIFRLRSTNSPAVNSGFQFRSRRLPNGDVAGYQVDNNYLQPWKARLYDEFGRHDLALQGERTVFDRDGTKHTQKLHLEPGADDFQLDQWHEYHLIAQGRKLSLRVNGKLIAEVTDNDDDSFEALGLLAMQLHTGPPMKEQFKDIRLKRLKPAQKPTARDALLADASLCWQFGERLNAHQPPLNAVGKITPNMPATGAGARPGSFVAKFESAYFDLQRDLNQPKLWSIPGEALSVYLRARVPDGNWNAGLLTKRGNHDVMNFCLFGADLPDTPGPDIGFEVHTDKGFVMVSFPVSQVDATGWLHLIGRYDGKKISLLCNGRLMAEKAWSGKLTENNEPILIGAASFDGLPKRYFSGEMEEAAIWSRALSDAEISTLLRVPAKKVLPVPDKLVVLTFDDAVKSHRTFVAPLLKELGFGATFFVTHRWMDDPTNFMTWQEIAEIHQMGFEIGNHSWTHSDFSSPKDANRLPGELYLVDRELDQLKIPRPTSFAYCGNSFGPEAVQRLSELGYHFARRGEQPEAKYATLEIGSTYDPKRHHPLLIPTTGDAYPNWSLQHLKTVLARAKRGQIVVLQFHGAPDVAHPWVNTPPERLEEYLRYLKQHRYRCIALRDLEPYLDRSHLPSDPMLTARQPNSDPQKLNWPVEMAASRKESAYWLENMLVYHHFTTDEAARVLGWSTAEIRKRTDELHLTTQTKEVTAGKTRVLPYPGGREVRLGFLDGNRDWQRGTKASVFLPWDPNSYVVMDLPEAIFSGDRLLFLGHTHFPTVFDEHSHWLDNVDWAREPNGGLHFERVFTNDFARFAFGASIQPRTNGAEMELWLRNDSDQPLTGLRTQVCGHLKGAPQFNEQTTANKIFRAPATAVHSAEKDRWIILAWERCGKTWGQPNVPCIHADPVLPDCAPGQTVRIRGRLWFYEGKDIDAELAQAKSRLFNGN
ncbi:MAG TPA: family 16 glycoside hydrolase [Candidatus Limnocylindrales bacterium]|nr:family 16 glycoside hydrolase [Candidatus Limnocylindrales bacterium]